MALLPITKSLCGLDLHSRANSRKPCKGATRCYVRSLCNTENLRTNNHNGRATGKRCVVHDAGGTKPPFKLYIRSSGPRFAIFVISTARVK
jgi:hypothetical protein